MLRLLICDDAPDAREAVRSSLAEQSEIEVVAEAATGEEAIALAASHEPNVVLMDVRMPGLDGIAATRRIRDLLPKTRIVAYAGSDDADDVMAMMEAGADAYCIKGAPLWELERAIAGATDPLARLAHAIARSVSGGGTAELVARELAELTGASFAATYLATADTSLSLAALSGPGAPDSLHSAPGVVARAFEELSLAQADTHELGELYRLGAACGEAIAAPFVADGQALGAVLVALPASVGAEGDPELVSAVADLVSVALASERRLAMTYVEARRDALTGLANKRAFDEHLDKLLDPTQRDRPVSLVLFDLDGFKEVNDQQGHVVGDDVLREVGRVFMRVVRAEDEIFRVGGEEFALVVEGTAREAGQIAERMRFGLTQSRRGHRLPTASAGIASVPEHARDPLELQRKADIALYAAKLSGKNRVQIYTGDREETSPVHPTPHLRPVADSKRGERGLRLLVVDDDPALRILLRTTFEVVDIEVEEADSAEFARERIQAHVPDVLVLDVSMPGTDGLTFCRQLKDDPETKHIGVVLLTGSDGGTETAAQQCGADAFLRKPFSPLELLNLVERIAGGLYEGPFRSAAGPPEEQLILYAQDLRRLLEVERGQRAIIQRAYRETVTALAGALETKDIGTGAHSQRVQRYAMELATGLDPVLLEDESVEYGFLLHDIGKIGIPDSILQKRGELSPTERGLLQTHTILGEQLLSGVALLQGQGLEVVRHHHERWDGHGYPDGLAQTDIPLLARVFAVADALDAMTSDRPYRDARSWEEAEAEILRERGHQFDPRVVDVFQERTQRLRRIHYELATA